MNRAPKHYLWNIRNCDTRAHRLTWGGGELSGVMVLTELRLEHLESGGRNSFRLTLLDRERDMGDLGWGWGAWGLQGRVCVCPCVYVCALMSVCLCACVNRRKGCLHLHRRKSNELMPGVLQLRHQLWAGWPQGVVTSRLGQSWKPVSDWTPQRSFLPQMLRHRWIALLGNLSQGGPQPPSDRKARNSPYGGHAPAGTQFLQAGGEEQPVRRSQEPTPLPSPAPRLSCQGTWGPPGPRRTAQAPPSSSGWAASPPFHGRSPVPHDLSPSLETGPEQRLIVKPGHSCRSRHTRPDVLLGGRTWDENRVPRWRWRLRDTSPGGALTADF